MERTGYVLRFEELGESGEAFGSIAAVPWDSDNFGFPVAQYRLPAEPPDDDAAETLGARLADWLRRHDIGLCSCGAPAASAAWRAILPCFGFQFVDLTLQVVRNGLNRATLPDARVTLREAAPRDREDVETIAGQAFHHGRYHADPRFPRELADLRYRRWVERALAGGNPAERIYVMEEQGKVQGFYHLTVEGSYSDLRLAAVAPELQGTMLGYDLYLAMLHTLRGLGVRRVVTTISGLNTAVMNVFSMLGFQFASPEVMYHWHGNTAARPRRAA